MSKIITASDRDEVTQENRLSANGIQQSEKHPEGSESVLSPFLQETQDLIDQRGLKQAVEEFQRKGFPPEVQSILSQGV